MKKFVVGQKVRYVGTKVEFSPLRGSVGTVKRVGAIGVDYQVAFPSDKDHIALWYHYDELEAFGYYTRMTVVDGIGDLFYAC